MRSPVANSVHVYPCTINEAAADVELLRHSSGAGPCGLPRRCPPRSALVERRNATCPSTSLAGAESFCTPSRHTLSPSPCWSRWLKPSTCAITISTCSMATAHQAAPVGDFVSSRSELLPPRYRYDWYAAAPSGLGRLPLRQVLKSRGP